MSESKRREIIVQETEAAQERRDNAIDEALEAQDTSDPYTQCKLLLNTVLTLRDEIKLLQLRIENLEAYNYH